MYDSYFILKIIFILLFIIVVSYINTLLYQQQHQHEGFYVNHYDSTRRWSPNTVQQFLYTQQSLNDPTQIQFDMDKVQQQATEEEATYFIQNKKWKWSDKVQKLYMDAIMNNIYIRSDPYESLKHAMTVYNETAILEVLSLFQTKEGNFLMKGHQIKGGLDTAHSGSGTYAINSGLETYNKLIRCEYKPSTKLPPYSNSQPSNTYKTLSDKNLTAMDFLSQTPTPTTPTTPTTLTTPTLTQLTPTTTQLPVQMTVIHKNNQESRLQEIDSDGPFISQIKDITDYKSLPSLVPGFQFLDEPCNPCMALDESRDKYSCPFVIKNGLNTNSYPSSIWNYLWFSHPENKVQKPFKEIDIFVNNPTQFDIWSIIQKLLNINNQT
jgi:hypothetical protein